MIDTIVSSSIGSIVSRLICHPIDTVKARFQLPNSPYKSTWEVAKVTLKEEGILGFYRGVGTVTGLGTPAFILYLCTYEECKNYFATMGTSSSSISTSNSNHKNKDLTFIQKYSFLNHFASGMIAESVSCLVYVPVDVVKERLQIQRKMKDGTTIKGNLPTYYKGTFHALTKIFQQEGLSGVYKGYGATLLSFGPFSAFYFLFYEQWKKVGQNYFYSKTIRVQEGEKFEQKLDLGASMKDHNTTNMEHKAENQFRTNIKRPKQTNIESPENVSLPFWYTLFAAAMAGAMASFVTNPLDLIRLRLQVQRGSEVEANGQSKVQLKATEKLGVESNTIYKNSWDGLQKIYKQDGIRGLFRGVNARIFFHTPSTMISMTCYEQSKKVFFSKN